MLLHIVCIFESCIPRSNGQTKKYRMDQCVLKNLVKIPPSMETMRQLTVHWFNVFRLFTMRTSTNHSPQFLSIDSDERIGWCVYFWILPFMTSGGNTRVWDFLRLRSKSQRSVRIFLYLRSPYGNLPEVLTHLFSQYWYYLRYNHLLSFTMKPSWNATNCIV